MAFAQTHDRHAQCDYFFVGLLDGWVGLVGVEEFLEVGADGGFGAGYLLPGCRFINLLRQEACFQLMHAEKGIVRSILVVRLHRVDKTLPEIRSHLYLIHLREDYFVGLVGFLHVKVRLDC